MRKWGEWKGDIERQIETANQKDAMLEKDGKGEK